MGPKNKKAERTYRPEGEIRRSQLLMGYGPGAMIDLLDDAVLIGGLEYWRYQDPKHPVEVIKEPRLTQKLVEVMRGLGMNPSSQLWLQAPPDCTYDEATPRQGIQALEFPRYFKCQRCSAIAYASEFEQAGRGRVHHCGPGYGTKPAPAVPVRFVAVCERGHISDWPWAWWTHRAAGRPKCDAPDIRLHEGASGDISDISVSCATCQSPPVKLASAMIPELRPDCGGDRPWLGDHDIAHQTCTLKARLLVRTATNGYLTQTMSALSLPTEDDALTAAVAGFWATLGDIHDLAALKVLRAHVPDIKQAFPAKWSDAVVLQAIERQRIGPGAALPPLDVAEYEAFNAAEPERARQQPPHGARFFACRMDTPPDGLPPAIDAVVLAAKLREVRAQFGFCRLEGAIAAPDGTYGQDTNIAALALDPKWLPAIEINGEGLFIRFDTKKLTEWEQQELVKAREDVLRTGFNRWLASRRSAVVFRGVRYYMLHTLAHLLMTAIALECGYSGSALRERIYCRAPDPRTKGDHGMAGILISTGTPGSEGTLGGLVEQGRHLRYHLRRAYDLGTLCSGDPVCALHQPDIHDARTTEGAACHSCLYIPETSCEAFNRFLDRALVFPTIGHPDQLAFFPARP
ncbi:MAG: DUF1998 domain-containing protein [Nannocystis sp.]|nr:DUF1998 domain-containing protein [Nannocystis sp.]